MKKVNLADIVATAKQVPVDGGYLEVRGLSIQDIAALIQSFPQVQDLIAGGADFNLFELAPEALAAAIAFATGNGLDPEAREAAAQLPTGVQADIVEAIVELTMPQGVAPIVKKLSRVLKSMGLTLSQSPEKMLEDLRSEEPKEKPQV